MCCTLFKKVPDFHPQNWFWNSYTVWSYKSLAYSASCTYWCVLTYFDALWHFNICSHEYANQRFLKTDKFWPFEENNLYLNPGFCLCLTALVGLSEFLLIFMIFSDREKAVCLMSILYMWRSSDGILGAEYALESHKLCPQMLPQMTLQGLMRGHKTLVEHPVWDFWRAASASSLAPNLVNPAGVSRWKCPIFHH